MHLQKDGFAIVCFGFWLLVKLCILNADKSKKQATMTDASALLTTLAWSAAIPPTKDFIERYTGNYYRHIQFYLTII